MLENKVKLQNLKGTYDFLPQEQMLRNNIIDTLRRVFERYGYQPIETPILCHYDVLASKYAGGAEILKEVYKLHDQGQRSLALRYDLTVPLARLVAMNPNLPLPFKRYEIGKVYRDGPVKLGRNREFYQCDVDVVGVKSVLIEAELIALTLEVFSELNINVYVNYNNRKLMSGLIELAGISENAVAEVVTLVDKIKKISKQEFESELIKVGLSSKQISALQNYFSMDLPALEKELADNENDKIVEGFNELHQLQGYLREMGIIEKTAFDLSLARGHEIYTGTVMEVFTVDKVITSSIAGGGRFDNIITKFIDNGNEYPACGTSFGLDVIYSYLMATGRGAEQNLIDLYIIPMGTPGESLKFANKMRKLGVRADLSFAGTNVSKAMKKANKLNVKYVVVIGEQELQTGEIKVKNMSAGDEMTFLLNDLESLAKYLRK